MRLNPKLMMRYQHYFAEQANQRIRDRSADGWVLGLYNARAVGANFSKKVQYPQKPLSLVADDVKGEPISDADRFSAWAEMFNAGMRGKQAALSEEAVSDKTAPETNTSE